ncbi:MAG: hypothetical protein VX561_00125 [Pseudomonadota bacterium]|nr:hypothetical protein [Pseudomonadota bacterium]
MEDALRGDWKSLLQNFAADALNNAFKSGGRMLFDLLQKGMGNGSGGWDFSKIGSTAASVLGKLPKFAQGGTIPGSGASGIDSQLVSFWKSPREQVDIYNPNNAGSGGRGGGRSPVAQILHVSPSKYFDVRVEELASPMSAAAFSTARKTVPSDMARTDRYTLGRHR